MRANRPTTTLFATAPNASFGFGGLLPGRPVGGELAGELGAAFGFVVFADGGGGAAQAVEGAQEAAVGLVAPADITGAPPTRLAQSVEAAVVADAEVGVGLDVVARHLAEEGPRFERPGPAGGDSRHRISTLGGLKGGP